MKKIIVILSVMIISFLMLAGCSGDNAGGTESPDGEQLLHTLWDGLQNSDTDALDGFMADGFQAVHTNGAIDKADELELIAGLAIDDYTLSDIKITQNGDTIVATYIVSVEETINGERLSKDPAARMSIFVNTADGWKWLGHANLKPLAN